MRKTWIIPWLALALAALLSATWGRSAAGAPGQSLGQQTIFVPATGGYNEAAKAPIVRDSHLGWPLADDAQCVAWGEFYVPDGAGLRVTVRAIVISETPGDLFYDSKAHYGTTGEAWQRWADDLNAVGSLAANTLAQTQPLSMMRAGKGSCVTLMLYRIADSPSDTIRGTVYLKGWVVTFE